MLAFAFFLPCWLVFSWHFFVFFAFACRFFPKVSFPYSDFLSRVLFFCLLLVHVFFKRHRYFQNKPGGGSLIAMVDFQDSDVARPKLFVWLWSLSHQLLLPGIWGAPYRQALKVLLKCSRSRCHRWPNRMSWPCLALPTYLPHPWPQNTTLTTAKTNVLRLEALNKFIVEKEKHTGWVGHKNCLFDQVWLKAGLQGGKAQEQAALSTFGGSAHKDVIVGRCST